MSEECPMCGAPRSGRFCEEDGYDFETRAAPARASPPAAWTAVITADRAYHASVLALGGPDAASVPFPDHCPERVVPLDADRVHIGRRRTPTTHPLTGGPQARPAPRGGAGDLVPEIDLGGPPEIEPGGPPEDPGVSHRHAVLIAQPDGGWVVVDSGSTNGTTLNGGTVPLDPDVPYRVEDGDRLHVGAWTTITLRGGTP